MEWHDKMTYRLRSAYFNVATRFGICKSGSLKLRRDVSACEYEDIQTMWEMLQRSESEPAGSALQRKKKKKKKKNKWKMFECARCASFSSVSG